MKTLMHLCTDRAIRRPLLIGMLPDDEPGSGGGGGGGTPPAKTFDQDAVNRMTTEARERGKREAIKDIAEKFGMSPDEAAAKFKEMTDAETARLSEVERREKAAADKETAATQREAAAAEKTLAADVRSALADAGSTGENQADAAILIRGSIDAKADEAAIKTAVETLKARRPELFVAKTADEGDEGKAPASDPGKPPASRSKPTKTAEQRARERLESMGVLKKTAATT